nr:SDR family NAD(P)-dependent oxidoreductase [Sphingobium fuliginis]
MSGLFSLAGRTAMVTGASRGLGRAIALGLADAGASLILAARDGAKLEETAEEIRAAGGRAQTIAFDLADLDAVQATTDRLNAEARPSTYWSITAPSADGDRSTSPPSPIGRICSM